MLTHVASSVVVCLFACLFVCFPLLVCLVLVGSCVCVYDILSCWIDGCLCACLFVCLFVCLVVWSFGLLFFLSGCLFVRSFVSFVRLFVHVFVFIIFCLARSMVVCVFVCLIVGGFSWSLVWLVRLECLGTKGAD